MFNGCGKCLMALFSGFRNLGEKFCVSWALPLIECVAVWALKLPEVSAPLRSLQNRSPLDFLQHIPTHSKPTHHKAFLLNYWKLNRLSSNNCHRPLNTKNNIQRLHQPPHFSIRFKLFSQHLQIGNCSFTMRDFEHRRRVEGVVCPHAPLRVFT